MEALSLVAAFAGALALVAPAAAQNAPAASSQASACTLSLAPAAVAVQGDPFRLAATPSQPIGAVNAASIQEKASGLQIALAAATEPAAAPSGASSDAASAQKPAAPAQQSAPATAQSGAAAPVVQALNLSLNTSAARAGDWTVSLKGASGTCTGKIHVDAAAPKQ
jgi:hypothetical protein